MNISIIECISISYNKTPGFCFAAIDLISNLLQVNKRKRMTVEKSMEHIWLQVSEARWSSTTIIYQRFFHTDESYTNI